MAEHDWQEAQSDWRQARREVYAEMLRDSVEARKKGQPPKYSKDQLDEVCGAGHIQNNFWPQVPETPLTRTIKMQKEKNL